MSAVTQRFIALLRYAQDAQNEVDNFDLHSEDYKSVAAFRYLKKDFAVKALALIAFVSSHEKEIVDELTREFP